MIYGYPDVPSVLPGDELTLHVSTDAPQFRVELYRCGVRPELVAVSPWLDGQAVPPHLPYEDWGREGVGLHGEAVPGWPGYACAVPPDWTSGVYVAVFVEGDGRGKPAGPGVRTLDARDSQALFVVKSAVPTASMLYKLPLLTYHAYNQVSRNGYDPATQRGGWCLYTVPEPPDLPVPVPPSVSLRRPGGGTGGTPFDITNFDPFDPTPRQTFTHWDGPFVAWLERAGYAVDYCTDLDVHRDGDLALLRGYRLLLSVGHDEYWSDTMRANVERFVDGGHNVAFFSGNTCWWRVAFDDEYSFRRLRNWSDRPVPDRPENSLTGVSYRNGGERDYDRHPVHVGYRAQHTDHWVYAGTGLADGDTFGDGPGEYIVGYECDGAHFDRGRLARNLPVHPTGDDGTPEDFTILGVGDASVSGWGLGNRAATMGVHTGVHNGNGTVFTAATTDWARVLAGGSSPVVDRITRNVLDRLSS
jgi:hypothetical protein